MNELWQTVAPWLPWVAAGAGGYFVRSLDPVARLKAALASLTKPKG